MNIKIFVLIYKLVLKVDDNGHVRSFLCCVGPEQVKVVLIQKVQVNKLILAVLIKVCFNWVAMIMGYG